MSTIPISPDDPLPQNALIKIPRQPRSIAMVHCILNAGMEVIRDAGLQSMSTNRVAERAGVSIGSLYQYFSNRESILAGIIERSLMDIDRLLQTFLYHSKDVEAEVLLRSGMLVMLRYYDEYLSVLRPILREAPLLAHGSAAMVMERSLTEMLQTYLLHNSHRYRMVQGYAGMYVAVNSVIYIYLKWIVEPSRLMTEDQLVDAIVSQIMSAIETISSTDEPPLKSV